MKQQYNAPELFTKDLPQSIVLNRSNDVNNDINVNVGNGAFDAE